MTNQELADYIHGELEHGVSESEIRSALLKVGWSDADITENFHVARQAHNVHSLSFSLEPKEKREFLSRRSRIVIALILAVLLLGGLALVYINEVTIVN